VAADGEIYELTIDLDATSWLFEPGHRLRLSISNADFPNTWPTSTLATSRVHYGPARPSGLVLPVVPPAVEPLPVPGFEPSPFEADDPPPHNWRVTRDPMTGWAEVAIGNTGSMRIDGVWMQETESEAVAAVDERDPARAWMRGRQTVRYRWPGQTIELQSRGQIASDATTLHLTLHVAMSVDGQPHLSRRWVRAFPRHLL
jgi:hypothetical protein